MRLRKLVGTVCLCLFVLLARGQRGGTGGHGATDYDRQWQAVDSLLNVAGLPESALSEIGRIEAMALEEHNDAQEIKALIYRLTIRQQKNENDDTSGIRSMEKRLAGAPQPERSILESLLARSYWSYLQRNRVKFHNRTAMVAHGGDDLTTWTTGDFRRRISGLYSASVKEDGFLERAELAEWGPVLIKGNSRQLRPTLYDILAHEALEYFKNNEASIDQPEDVYEIDDTTVFADAAIFARHVFRGMDTSSPHYKALLLYQHLITLHLGDTQPDALINVDIERLMFAHSFSSEPDKNLKYPGVLARLTDQWGDLPAVAEAWYLRAQQVHNGAGADRMVRAKAICERVLREPDSSEGRMNCRILLNEIIRPGLDLQTEQFNLPGKPFRCLVKWSNLGRIYIRLVKIDSAMWKKERTAQEYHYWSDWLPAPVYRSFSQDLPDSADYLTHTAEIPVGSLPPGSYALIASVDSSWDTRKGVILGQRIYVSSIAYLHDGGDYFVVNRESGQPLNDTRVQIWKRHWDNLERQWQLSKAEIYHTDQQGYFQVQKHESGDQLYFEFQRRGEDLYLTNGVGSFNSYSQPNPAIYDKEEYENINTVVFFFLDRSIYRPGQQVYFKGISVTRDDNTRQFKAVAGRKGEIYLSNANNEEIDSIELTTDEFGAYHGIFHLPEQGLNGWFKITDEVGEGSSKRFHVEEYKRPGFAISFERLKGIYRVGDSIRVKGAVTAYAGNTLDGATVKYRVTRTLRPVYRSYKALRRIPSKVQEIAHGVIRTDASGNFGLVFDALPDRGIPEASDPRFNYRVEADVTDINGETRSESTTVVAGYSVYDLSIRLDGDEAMMADSLRAIRVDISNLSGEPVPAVVHLAAYPLQPPNRLIRERLWTMVPDRWVMSEQAFLDSFPHDEYREELKKETWPKGAAAWKGLDSTGGHPVALRLKPGWWEIEATATDASGHVTKDLRYIELYDDQTGGPVNPEYLWGAGQLAHKSGVRGATVRIETASSAKDIFIVRQVLRPHLFLQSNNQYTRVDNEGDSLKYRYVTASNGQRVDDWFVSEADRGGFGVADAFVKDNRLYLHRTVVQIPWNDKELKIHYTSFRDKTEPGSPEKWAVRISGWRGSSVAAQVLASMYDASLDQFEGQSWAVPYLYPSMGAVNAWQNIDDFGAFWSISQGRPGREFPEQVKSYDRLMTVGNLGPGERLSRYRNSGVMERNLMRGDFMAPDEVVVVGYASQSRKDRDGSSPEEYWGEEMVETKEAGLLTRAAPSTPPVPVVRTNFQETAFFLPDLRTDSAGAVSFSFTMPESLTKWKWMTLAHTRDLAFGYSEKTIISQKQLMVQPNIPRFLREGDKINLSVKVVNLTDSEMTGQLGLSLTDPTNGETADGMFLNRQPNQYFTVPARGSSIAEFPVDIPYQYNRPVSYRIVAEAGAFSDGEQATLPVVSNRMLVTETLPLDMPGDGVRSFTFGKLLRSGSSETLNHHALTVEFTANPAWYSVQALPYLMEYPYECAEQTFDRLYANAVASKITHGSPRIAQVFERWRTMDTSALLSNLEKNPELKSVLLEETPWVLEGKSETQQKKNLALLFDLTRISGQLGSTIEKLQELQAQDGAFPWFKGGPDDRYVTQYILTGLGRLQRMKALPPTLAEKAKSMVTAALDYADKQIKADYVQDIQTKVGTQYLPSFAAQYLYMRSLFNEVGIPGGSFAAVNYYRKLAQQDWVKADKMIQGMVALALFRTGDIATARSILASLRQTAIRSEELGMYWKGMEGGYYWYQAPVETEALMIEAFREIGQDTAADRQLKTWLIRQKQTHNWASTKATADAVYALLGGGSDWLDQEREVKVQLGDKVVEMSGEAGTGYDKKIFDAPFIDTSMGHIKVSVSPVHGRGAPQRRGGSPAWGAVYWQYFDQLDQITPPEGGAKSPLRLEKRIYVQRNTDRGPVLDTVAENGSLHIGDRVVVRLLLRADRDLEYVHLKDMRGACLEPINVLSGYQWQRGLGYYESTKDVSTEFFFSSVPRGTYVFEYPLVVEQTGEFSNGVASVECLYAPEFAFHTEGIRINVEAAQ